MIHVLGHSSGECDFLGEFGTNYTADQPTRDHRSNPIPRKGFQKKQDNYTIIDNVVDELHMVESKKVSTVNHEAPDFLKVTTMRTTCIR